MDQIQRVLVKLGRKDLAQEYYKKVSGKIPGIPDGTGPNPNCPFKKNKEEEKQIEENSDLKGFVVNIEKETINNKNFRKVLYTGKNSQLVLMLLKSGEDIGDEIHDVDQFFRIDSGSGKIIINGKEHKISDGSAFIIPAGAKHNVINNGKEDLKLYSIYSPPHHQDGIIHKTKKDALKDKEHFDGKTTEKTASKKTSSFTIKKPLKLLKEDGKTRTSLANADG